MKVFSEQCEMYKKWKTVGWPNLARRPVQHTIAALVLLRSSDSTTEQTNTRRNLN